MVIDFLGLIIKILNGRLFVVMVLIVLYKLVFILLDVDEEDDFDVLVEEVEEVIEELILVFFWLIIFFVILNILLFKIYYLKCNCLLDIYYVVFKLFVVRKYIFWNFCF